MKKLITMPKKKTVTRHQFEPVKNALFGLDTDTPSITPLTTTHYKN